jgi:dephospho-CoA kinase
MLVAGLTGGIGSGKSTFASLLAELGAEVIDADALGRAALNPGEPAWHATVDQFGDDILVATGLDIDRKRLAAIVFNDPSKLAALNAIVHPVITRGIADTLETLSGTDEIVILDAALIVELGLDQGLDALIVVTAPEKQRRERLSRTRHMADEDITARMLAQASEEDLIARADIVVKNEGTPEGLAQEAGRVWEELQRRRPA